VGDAGPDRTFSQTICSLPVAFVGAAALALLAVPGLSEPFSLSFSDNPVTNGVSGSVLFSMSA
jgi:hypothetical protein